jgi:hypothetical protein
MVKEEQKDTENDILKSLCFLVKSYANGGSLFKLFFASNSNASLVVLLDYFINLSGRCQAHNYSSSAFARDD